MAEYVLPEFPNLGDLSLLICRRKEAPLQAVQVEALVRIFKYRCGMSERERDPDSKMRF